MSYADRKVDRADFTAAAKIKAERWLRLVTSTVGSDTPRTRELALACIVRVMRGKAAGFVVGDYQFAMSSAGELELVSKRPAAE